MKSTKAVKTLLLGTLGAIAMIFFLGCEEKLTDSSRESDEAALKALMNEIVSLSEKGNCEDATGWKVVPIGAKPCGGPTGYVAYYNTIDTNDFIKKVKQYTDASDQFNKKWGTVSDCSLPPMPIGVVCNSIKKPMLLYKHTIVLEGVWYLTETWADPGDGSGRYTPVTGRYKYLNLNKNGTVTGDAIPDLVSYVVLDENRIEFTRSPNLKVIYRYSQTGANLELNPPCIEGCGFKFSRMQ